MCKTDGGGGGWETDGQVCVCGGGVLIIQEGHWMPQEIARFLFFFFSLSNSGWLNDVFAASGGAKGGGVAEVRKRRRSRWTLSARSKADHRSCSERGGPSVFSQGR